MCIFDKNYDVSTKLTLTMEKDIIDRAKVYAKEKNRSLSDIIENYLKIITENKKEEVLPSPIVESLIGSFRLPKNFDYKRELRKKREEKYR